MLLHSGEVVLDEQSSPTERRTGGLEEIQAKTNLERAFVAIAGGHSLLKVRMRPPTNLILHGSVPHSQPCRLPSIPTTFNIESSPYVTFTPHPSSSDCVRVFGNSGL